jgi:hypothetical protein
MRNIPNIHKYYSTTPKCLQPVNALLLKNGVAPATNGVDMSNKLHFVFEKNKNNEDFLKDFIALHPDKDMLLWYADKVKESEKVLTDDKKYSNCIACNGTPYLNQTGDSVIPKEKQTEIINTIIISGAILVGAMILVKVMN